MTVTDILDYRAWKPALVTGLGVLVVLGVTFGAGYWQGTKRNEARATHAETQANIAKGERDAITAQAQAKDQEIAAKNAAIVADKRALARANAEIQRIKDLPPIVPIGPGTPDLSPVVERQRELIAAYEVGKQASEQFTKGLETKIADLTISRDLHIKRAEAGERESTNLRIALDAHKEHKTAFGGVWGTTAWGDKALGVFVDRDIAMLRIGVEVTKNTYAIQARQGLEVRAKLGFRF